MLDFLGWGLMLLGAFFYATFAFAQIWYPITFSAPRVIYYSLKKEFKVPLPKIIFFELIGIVFWASLTVTLCLLTHHYLNNQFKVFYIGLILGATYCFIFANKKDLYSDFYGYYGKFLKTRSKSDVEVINNLLALSDSQ